MSCQASVDPSGTARDPGRIEQSSANRPRQPVERHDRDLARMVALDRDATWPRADARQTSRTSVTDNHGPGA